MTTYQVTIMLSCGILMVEVEFEDSYSPTDDEIHDAAVRQIEYDLSMSKLECWSALSKA